jgi:hypothetical protein
MLAVSILWPWHLEVPVALALLVERPAFQLLGLVLTLLALLSYFFTFWWSAVGIGVVGTALWVMRTVRANDAKGRKGDLLT